MKVWYGFGSEHSARLVMVGRFQTAEDAEVALREFEELRDLIEREFDYARFDENPWDWYRNEPLTERLRESGLHYVAPDDIEHFARDLSANVNGDEVEIRTDEDDINGFLTFLIHRRAHVEVYSAHDFTNGPPVRAEGSAR